MTEAQQSPVRYHSAAIMLHWLIAALLVYQFALGLRLEDATGATKFNAFQFHKSIGITVLLLSLVRLALRLFLRRPAEVGDGVQRLGARLVHFGFYAVMILTPLTGWIIVSTAKVKLPTLLFGVIPWPHLAFPGSANEPAELAHTVLAWSLPLLIALHLAGVLYHLRLRDEVPQRMFSSGVAPAAGLIRGLAALAAVGLLGIAGPVPSLWGHAGATAAPVPAPTDSGEASDAGAIIAATEPAAEASEQAEATTAATSCDWTVEPGSRLGFKAQYGGAPIDGTFHKWQAKIRFCEDDLPHASIAATVNLASADTADASRDENLKGESFFDTGRFAQARFNATGFKQVSPGRFAASGTLNLHGVSKPVRLAFALKVAGDAASAQGSTSLSRLAFGVGSGEWAATDQIPDAVAVQFTIRARRAN